VKKGILFLIFVFSIIFCNFSDAQPDAQPKTGNSILCWESVQRENISNLSFAVECYRQDCGHYPTGASWMSEICPYMSKYGWSKLFSNSFSASKVTYFESGPITLLASSDDICGRNWNCNFAAFRGVIGGQKIRKSTKLPPTESGFIYHFYRQVEPPKHWWQKLTSFFS